MYVCRMGTSDVCQKINFSSVQQLHTWKFCFFFLLLCLKTHWMILLSLIDNEEDGEERHGIWMMAHRGRQAKVAHRKVSIIQKFRFRICLQSKTKKRKDKGNQAQAEIVIHLSWMTTEGADIESLGKEKQRMRLVCYFFRIFCFRNTMIYIVPTHSVINNFSW